MLFLSLCSVGDSYHHRWHACHPSIASASTSHVISTLVSLLLLMQVRHPLLVFVSPLSLHAPLTVVLGYQFPEYY